MKLLFAAAALAAMTVQVTGQGARAQAPEDPSAYLVTYIEVAPSAEAQTAGLLRQVAAASRKEAGNLRYDILEHRERKGQFAILETWSDSKALEAHRGGPAMKQLRGELDPLRISLYDERLDNAIDVAQPLAPPGKDAIYVITHIDVTGQFKDEAIIMMKKLAADTRREPGAERFDVWQQSNRLNHFTVTEIWKDQAALDAHGGVAGTREFREKVGHMLGALYDDRRYRSLQ
jgi:quinol monooxygenase YgiN